MSGYTEADGRAGAANQSFQRLDALLAPLTEKQLRRVLQALVEGRPELVDEIEREVQWLTQEPTAAGQTAFVQHSIPVDLATIR
jgi:hypothetical protein